MNLVTPRLRKALVDQRIARLSERLSAVWKMAELVHPERPLGRGFVRVTDRNGQTLTHAADALSARQISLHFADGTVEATTGGPPAQRAVERKGRNPYVAPQPGLFDGEE